VEVVDVRSARGCAPLLSAKGSDITRESGILDVVCVRLDAAEKKRSPAGKNNDRLSKKSVIDRRPPCQWRGTPSSIRKRGFLTSSEDALDIVPLERQSAQPPKRRPDDVAAVPFSGQMLATSPASPSRTYIDLNSI
jgi:hypothetical protein